MIILNKKLIYLIIILIPLTIISFFFKEANFIVSEEESEEINNIKNEDVKVLVKVGTKVENLDIEEYVIGVVAGEMPALFENDALKAQAIASRTYVINHFKKNNSISNTISDQVYITDEEMQEKWHNKFDEYYNKIKNAVQETKGLIMYYNKEPIKAYYYAMSNGYTESSLNVFNEQNDYLNIVKSPFDEDNEHRITISLSNFCQKLEITCNNIEIKDIKKDNSNRIANITINNKKFTGIEVRKKLSLRSTDFEITTDKENAYIKTKGYGHGVGMSQHGANNMAKLGYSYEEILKYYYQNVEINSI